MLEEQARRLDVVDRITWYGTIRDAGRLFTAFDVFALSSRTEGTPMVLFEAMAARVPIVAARVGGVPNVVGPAEAILVPPGDPTELASAIHAVRADPLAARARAQAAHDRLAREFRVEPWLARYEQLYHEIRS
jgi:glycosyltransferase involved in cell wall biosynthesis